MGLFNEKLILDIVASVKPSGKLKIHIKEIDNTIRHLIPFSCISIIFSQLTVLTNKHPQSLCMKVLDFVENPNIKYRSIKLVSGFNLEVYKGKGQTYFNQFYPQFAPHITQSVNDIVETDIEHILMNYPKYVFDDSSSNERTKLQAFSLAAILFFQQELIPIIKRIDMNNLGQRMKLASDQINFCSSILQRWDSPIPFMPGSQLFLEHIDSAKKFKDY